MKIEDFSLALEKAISGITEHNQDPDEEEVQAIVFYKGSAAFLGLYPQYISGDNDEIQGSIGDGQEGHDNFKKWIAITIYDEPSVVYQTLGGYGLNYSHDHIHKISGFRVVALDFSEGLCLKPVSDKVVNDNAGFPWRRAKN